MRAGGVAADHLQPPEAAGVGERFVTGTDTEVLLRGYQEWGIDGLCRRIEGMFAFGIWDHARRRLFLVRDRLGVKHLVYASTGRDIAFASTVSALRARGVGGEIDPEIAVYKGRFGHRRFLDCGVPQSHPNASQ